MRDSCRPVLKVKNYPEVMGSSVMEYMLVKSGKPNG